MPGAQLDGPALTMSRSVDLLWECVVARPLGRTVIALTAISATLASVVLVPGGRGILGAGLAVVVILIAAVDARYYIIPNELTIIALVLGLISALLGDPVTIWGSLLPAAGRGIVLALVFWSFRVIYRMLRRRDGIGLGDVKLAGVAGVWLEWLTIPVVIEIAAVAALSTYLIKQFVLGRRIRSTNRLPFGLFFAPAIWFGWLIEAALLVQPDVFVPK